MTFLQFSILTWVATSSVNISDFEPTYILPQLIHHCYVMPFNSAPEHRFLNSNCNDDSSVFTLVENPDLDSVNLEKV